LSDLEYGLSYTCFVSVHNSTETFADNFTFQIEAGYIPNSNYPDYFYYSETQELANYTPDWSKSRFDKFSNFQQLINPIGEKSNRFESLLIKQISDYFVQTADLSRLGTIYKVNLPASFSFETILLDNGDTLYKPPRVYGQRGIHRYPIFAEYNNDLYNFYYNKSPDSISDLYSPFGLTEILPITPITFNNINVNHDMKRNGNFVIELIGCNTFTKTLGNSEFDILTCQVYGVSLFNEPQTEVLAFVSNGTSYSSNLWSRIDYISFYNIPDNFIGSFRIDYFKSALSKMQDVDRYVDTEEVKRPIYRLDNDSGYSILQVYANRSTDIIESALRPGNDILREFDLYDVDNTSHLLFNDFVLGIFDSKIYAITDDCLYLYDKKEEYPKVLKELNGLPQDPITILDIEAEELSPRTDGQSITFAVTQMVFSKKVKRYRIRLLKPDSSEVFIGLDGSEMGSTWFTNENATSNFRSNLINLVLDQVGDYVLYVDTLYSDGTYDIDGRVVRTLRKSAIAKYKLNKYLGSETARRIIFDYDQKIKILDSANNLHVIDFHKNNMLVDYDEGSLYFSEKYDKVSLDD